MTEKTQNTFESLDSDLDSEVIIQPDHEKVAGESFLDAAAKFAQKECPRCKGSGEWVGGYVNHVVRACAICKGSGLVGAGYKYKTPAEYAEWKQKRMANAIRKQEAERSKFEGWQTANPVEWSWMKEASGRGFEFATKLIEDVRKFGGLTQGQRDAIYRMIAKREDATKARETNAPLVDGAGLGKLTEAFSRALATGLKSPKVRIGEVVFSLAKTAANAGCLYVKTREGVYLGKITPSAKLMKGQECTERYEAMIIEIGRDPQAAAVAHGKQTGSCAICGRHLENAESVERGIGPICADKFGW